MTRIFSTPLRAPRRKGLALAALAAAALLASLLTALPPALDAVPTASASERAAAHTSRPNIVLILTDDMRADELRYLPAVRHLQRSGVTFTRAISADSLCCPARATLLTGKLAHNHLTIGNNTATHGGYHVFAEHNDVQDLLPQWLDDRAYRTGWIGKYLNDFGGSRHFDQPDWTYFASPVQDVYDYWSNGFAINGHFHVAHGYREVYTRQLLLSRIKAWSRGWRPFFLVDSTIAPHKQRKGGGRFRAPGVQNAARQGGRPALRVSPSVGETDLTDKPAWLQEYAARPTTPKIYPRTFERKRVQALQSVNKTVKRVVETLREQHELKSTVLIFTSDNGFMLREHDLTDKNKAYEESVHVPLVIRGPGFSGGRRADQTVSLADLTATFRRLAGVRRSHGADGVPLQEVLAQPASFARRPIEIEGSAAQYPDMGSLGTDSIGRFYSGVVWGPYSLVHYQTGDWEFYDRTVDPWQMDNSYSSDPGPGSAQELLQTWYAAHLDCRGAACNDRIPLSPTG
ncbi:sulfatase-like hydrolase/transferase [Nocardioides sp.]|jgi:arylsulfatase A-like enzyme|uniref:sulfatase-like hydrolase/transferase n=1 Tax=Nocardioides sp. TaxID=35761 RepID=UPI002F41B224